MTVIVMKKKPKPRKDHFWERAAFPDNTDVRMKYKNEFYYGIIKDNQVIYEGVAYRNFAPISMKVKGFISDSWYFWEYRLPGFETWRPAYERKRLTA